VPPIISATSSAASDVKEDDINTDEETDSEDGDAPDQVISKIANIGVQQRELSTERISNSSQTTGRITASSSWITDTNSNHYICGYNVIPPTDGTNVVLDSTDPMSQFL